MSELLLVQAVPACTDLRSLTAALFFAGQLRCRGSCAECYSLWHTARSLLSLSILIVIGQKLWLLALTSMVLVGCSRAPSSSDIEAAYRAEVEPVNAMSRQISGEALIIQVNAVEKKSCEKTATEHYLCQVEIDSTLPFVGQRKTATELTLTKQEGQWKIIRSER